MCTSAVLAHPYQGPTEDEGAIVVGDTDIDIFPVPDAKPLRIGGICVDVSRRDDEAVGGYDSRRQRAIAEKGQLRHPHGAGHSDTGRDAGLRFRILPQLGVAVDPLSTSRGPSTGSISGRS